MITVPTLISCSDSLYERLFESSCVVFFYRMLQLIQLHFVSLFASQRRSYYTFDQNFHLKMRRDHREKFPMSAASMVDDRRIYKVMSHNFTESRTQESKGYGLHFALLKKLFEYIFLYNYTVKWFCCLIFSVNIISFHEFPTLLLIKNIWIELNIFQTLLTQVCCIYQLQ